MARPPLRLFHFVFEPHDGRAFCADSEEKREPVSDIDTALVDSLKVLDPKRPIREADIAQNGQLTRPRADHVRKPLPSPPSSAKCDFGRGKCCV